MLDPMADRNLDGVMAPAAWLARALLRRTRAFRSGQAESPEDPPRIASNPVLTGFVSSLPDQAKVLVIRDFRVWWSSTGATVFVLFPPVFPRCSSTTRVQYGTSPGPRAHVLDVRIRGSCSGAAQVEKPGLGMPQFSADDRSEATKGRISDGNTTVTATIADGTTAAVPVVSNTFYVESATLTNQPLFRTRRLVRTVPSPPFGRAGRGRVRVASRLTLPLTPASRE